MQGTCPAGAGQICGAGLASADPWGGGCLEEKPFDAGASRLFYCPLHLSRWRGTDLRGNKKAFFVCDKKGFSSVGKTGFEPATLWSQTRCATGLRYFPISFWPQSVSGDPNWIRTNDLLLRRQLLYPAELWGQTGCKNTFFLVISMCKWKNCLNYFEKSCET